MPQSTVVSLNEAIRFLKKKHNDLMARSDDTFKRAKISFNDVITSLKKIYGTILLMH